MTGDSGVVPDAICSFLNKIDDMEKRISCGWQEEQALRAHEEASLEVVAGKKQLTAEHSGTAASTSSRQPSARSRTASPGPLRIHLESSEAALGSPAQVTLALSGGDAGNTHEPGSPSACETPRNWEEHALELQEELAASQLQSQQDREAFESDLRDLQKQLQHERLLRRNAQAPALDNAGAAEDAARVKCALTGFDFRCTFFFFQIFYGVCCSWMEGWGCHMARTARLLLGTMFLNVRTSDAGPNQALFLGAVHKCVAARCSC